MSNQTSIKNKPHDIDYGKLAELVAEVPGIEEGYGTEPRYPGEDDPDFLSPSSPESLGVLVPVDKRDHEGMLLATYHLMMRGVTSTLMLARYLRVTAVQAVAYRMEVDAQLRSAVRETDPEILRSRLASQVEAVQTEAMRVYHGAMTDATKVASLKAFLNATKMYAEVTEIVGPSVRVSIDNSDNRTVTVNNVTSVDDLDPETRKLLAAAMTATASAKAAVKAAGAGGS